MKAISKEQIDALPRYFGDSHDGCRHIGYLTEDNQGTAVLLDDLRALYDNAPSVENSDPVGYVSEGSLQSIESGRDGISGAKSNLRVHPLYTTQQPNRVAELEAKLARMRSAFHVNMVRAFPNMTHDEISQAIDQAMKG